METAQPAGTVKHCYALRYQEDGVGQAKRVEFDAANPAYALSIAAGEARGRWAELSRAGTPLCHLGSARSGEDYLWIIQ
ncbi:hypothetical protein [Sphingopyxis sp. MWB1]|uniref:hypothetical protein n=1 Tax=Sphingopyxis sp. MWB1 TaxID=1537715 RepID=UPI00051A1860|nr:hypothetical protein [Sphingopyxis sp. MWB1]